MSLLTPPHRTLTSWPSGEEALKVALKTLLSGTIHTCHLARRRINLSAAILAWEEADSWGVLEPEEQVATVGTKQSNLRGKLHPLVNFARTPSRRLKAWIPYPGARLTFSFPPWLPLWACEPGVIVLITWESSK